MGYTIKKEVTSRKKDSEGSFKGEWNDETVKLEHHDDQLDAIQRILDLMNAAIDKGWELRRAYFSLEIKDTEEESKLLFVNVDEK